MTKKKENSGLGTISTIMEEVYAETELETVPEDLPKATAPEEEIVGGTPPEAPSVWKKEGQEFSVINPESVSKRSSDSFDLEENISQYLQGIIKLRDRYANRLYALLVFEVVVMFTFVYLYGVGFIKLEEWTVAIVAESVLIKTFLTVQMIVKNLFPNKSLIELLLKNGK